MMKKTFFAAMLALIMVISAGCTSVSGFNKGMMGTPDPAKPDYSALKHFEFDGFSIYLPGDMQEQEAVEGITEFYANDVCLMTALDETYEMFADVGYDGAALTLEEYGELVKEGNGIEQEFAEDEFGNYSTTYISNIDGDDFFYYSVVYKGTDRFMLITFACLNEDAEKYLSHFELWAGSVELVNKA